jgi:hypothetical protein
MSPPLRHEPDAVESSSCASPAMLGRRDIRFLMRDKGVNIVTSSSWKVLGLNLAPPACASSVSLHALSSVRGLKLLV